MRVAFVVNQYFLQEYEGFYCISTNIYLVIAKPHFSGNRYDQIRSNEKRGELAMVFNALETKTMRATERAMNVAAVRAEVLSQNIANVNTPNYKRAEVDFSAILEETLAQNQIPLERTHNRHLLNLPPGNLSPRIYTETATASRKDGNNVDVEFEMAQLTENSMYYQALSSAWKKEIAKLRMAIQGRG